MGIKEIVEKGVVLNPANMSGILQAFFKEVE